MLKAFSFFGLLVIVLFPIAMLFVGFAKIEIHCLRDKAGMPPVCEIRETRLLGLYNRKAVAINVTDISYRTRDVDTSSRSALASTVVLEGLNGSIPVSEVSSNVGDAWKSDLITETRHFLDNPSKLNYAAHINERNIFGWIGLAFIAFFLWAYIRWFYRKIAGRT